MKTFIESVLPPVYLTLIGAYEVHLNPLNGDPNFDATATWGQPKKRNGISTFSTMDLMFPFTRSRFDFDLALR
jgi:hypothetical protein